MTAQPKVPCNSVIVIMAGGAGERFWPVSNRATPKQLLRLHGDQSMLEIAFNRASRIVEPERVYLVAGEPLRDAVFATLPGLLPGNYIAEPFSRNTAGCLGLAACLIESIHGADAVMGILTADHVIDEGEEFFNTIATALTHASETDNLVTIGIRPTCPDTAFGYLELGKPLAKKPDQPGLAIHRVRSFREKPNLETAEQMLAQGNFLWNSGMFFWRAGVLMKAFETHQPEMAEQWNVLRKLKHVPFPPEPLREVFEAIPSLSIDIAIMERSANVVAVVGTFGWEDIGSWDALARLHPPDEFGNCRIGPSVVLDSRNNIIYNDVNNTGEKGPEIVLHGVDDLVIVRTEKAIMITPKSRAQRVKEIVRHLANTSRNDLI